MGKSNSKNHEEYDRNSIKCRGYVEKYSFKRGESKKKYFILNKNTLGYSASKEIQPTHIINIDKNFKVLCDDLENKQISIECINRKGENSLWRLIFSNKENAERWAKKLKKAVRPVWEDPKSDKCYICGKKFKLLLRQHHCRNCGKVICSNHYKYVNEIPELGYLTKVKVCANCINRIGNVNGVQRANSLGEKEVQRKTILKYNSVRLSPENSFEGS